MALVLKIRIFLNIVGSNPTLSNILKHEGKKIVFGYSFKLMKCGNN